MILSMLDNKEIDLQFEHKNFDSFLCNGITLAIFSMDGKTRDEKDLLFSEDVIKFKLCESVVAINSDCSLG